jgi:hypothetical protein
MSLYFDQQHDPNSYLVKYAKNARSIQDDESKKMAAENENFLSSHLEFKKIAHKTCVLLAPS